MNELDDAIGEVAGKIRAVVGRAVFAEATSDEDLGVSITERELDVGIGFVVAQQDVEARLALLDEVVLKGQCLVLVGDEDVFNVDCLAHEGAGFGVGLRGFKKIGPDAAAEVLRLADIDDLALWILVEVDPGLGGEGADFLVKIHGKVR